MKIFLLFSIFYFLFSIANAFAQEVSIGIYPPIIQILAKPPAIINNPITIQNGSDQTITYGIFLMPFRDTDEKDGTPQYDRSLIDKYSEFFKRVQVSDGNKVITEIRLAPKQTKELNLRISVPREIISRDYYFSVLFISQDPSSSESNFTGARAGVAANVLVSLEPKAKSSGYIKEFSAPFFATKGPVGFKLSVANTSPHFVTAEGNIMIKNIFGQIIGDIELIPANILSGGERFLESEHNQDSQFPTIYWNEKFLIGIYSADLTLRLSEDGPILKKSLTFFAFPAELAAGILVSLILAIWVVRRVKRKEVE